MYWIGSKVSLFGGYPTILGGGGRVSRNRSLSPPLSYTANNNIYLIGISPIYPTCYTQLWGFFVLRKEHLDQVGVVPETRKAEVITHRPLPLLLLSIHPVLIISTKGFSPFANITNSWRKLVNHLLIKVSLSLFLPNSLKLDLLDFNFFTKLVEIKSTSCT